MTASPISTPSWVSHLSRRKLEKVAADDSSDTLRRSVLIHNVMRSTASLPCIESSTIATHPSSSTSVFHAPIRYSTSEEDDEFELEEDEEEELILVNNNHAPSYEFPSASAAAPAPTQPTSFFSFPKMTDRTAQEQQWLDSLLDDLDGEGGVHVSVVPVTDEPELSFDHHHIEEPSCFTSPQQPVFSQPPYLSRPSSPTPEYYYDSLEQLFTEPTSPTSPPGLDANTDSDEDDEDEADSPPVTPHTSTEALNYQPDYFLPYPPRNRPHRFNLFH